MKIDNWPLDRIMRLPDWCFGRRYWVGNYSGGTNGVVNSGIVEEELPDKFVVWGLLFSSRSPSMAEAMRLTVRLSAERIADVPPVGAYDRLFKGISTRAITYEFYIQHNSLVWIPCERQIIESAGRRIAFITNGDQSNTYESTIGVQISALPKEVPDWLFSGQDKSLL